MTASTTSPDHRSQLGELLPVGPAEVLQLCATPVVRSGDSALPFRWTDAEQQDTLRRWTAISDAAHLVRTVRHRGQSVHVTEKLIFNKKTPVSAFFDTIHIALPKADRVWLPHLCPEPDDVVSDHAYRSPAAIIREGDQQVAVLPDLDELAAMRFTTLGSRDHQWIGGEADTRRQLPGYMVMLPNDNGSGSAVEVGLTSSDARDHVYFRQTRECVVFEPNDELTFAYELMFHHGSEPDGLRTIVAHLWQRYGERLGRDSLPQKRPFSHYAQRSLTTIERTPEYVEFTLADGGHGAGFRNCSSINGADIDSTNFKVPPRGVWFSAWFNCFRTAFGIAGCTADRHGRVSQRWRQRADWTKETLLSAPDPTGLGLIPAIYDYARHEWWPSVPTLGPGRDHFDISASAHTALWMLRWHQHIDADPRLLERAKRIVEFIVNVQESNGSFPAYVNVNGDPIDPLRNSAQSAAASVLLAAWAEHEPDDAVIDALQQSAWFYIHNLLPNRKYHDFEAFWSCSPKSLDFTDGRTRQEMQNTLGLSWIADALLRTYSLTGDERLRPWAQRATDDLCLYQQVWNPPYISLYTFGGFGVMNTDGEWSDTRGVWMSDILMLAARVLGQPEYFERGVAALRATCALVSDPLHADVNPCRYDTFPDGLAAENFAHIGYDGRAIRSGFDWGAGALLVAAQWARTQYGQLYIDLELKRAFGIDGIVVDRCDHHGDELRLTVREATGVSREIETVLQRPDGLTRCVIRINANDIRQLTVTRDEFSDARAIEEARR